MLSVILVNGRPNRPNAPNVSRLHALDLAIISIMYAVHPRRPVNQPLQLRVGLARIHLAKPFPTQKLLRMDFLFEGFLVVLPQNEITVWKVLLDLFS